MHIWTLRTFGKNPMFFVLVISLFFVEILNLFGGVLCQMDRLMLDIFSFFGTRLQMPLGRKNYSRFAVGQFVKAKKSLQEELAKLEKASLSTD